jgi:hypothetical protein
VSFDDIVSHEYVANSVKFTEAVLVRFITNNANINFTLSCE